MSLQIGKWKFEIIASDVRMVGDKPGVVFQCHDQDGDVCQVVVFMTEKSAGIARRSLKMAGFEVDKDDIESLAKDPLKLAGNKVEVLVEEYNGKLRPQILLASAVSPSLMTKMTTMLREAKKTDDGKKEGSAPFVDEDTGNVPF